MHLFVTGACGFIGSHFVARALRRGHQVTALRRDAGKQPRIAIPRQPTWIDKCLSQVDRRDLAGVDVVVHFAAHSVTPPHDGIEGCLRWNLIVPLRMFSMAAERGIGRFVVAGSCFEYGMSGQDYQFIPADAPLKPTTPYAASKAAASIAFGSFAAEAGVRVRIHRIFQAFGEGEADNRLWPSLRRAALAGEDYPMTAGEQVRDFVPVKQVVETFLDSCDSQTLAAGETRITNLGSGKPQSVRQFAEHWWDHWNATGTLRIGELPYRDGEVMRYVGKVD